MSPAETTSAPQASLGIVTGAVTSAVTGFAVEGCRVQADPAGAAGSAAPSDTDLTFPDGSYELELPPGRYTIRAYGPGADGARLTGKAVGVKVVAGAATTADVIVTGRGGAPRQPRSKEPASGQSPGWAGPPARPGPAPDVRPTPAIDPITGREDVADSDQGTDVPVCRADEVTVTLSWQWDGQLLSGRVTVTNSGDRTCRLPGKPHVQPLGTSGRPLRVPGRLTEEFMLPGYAIVHPGQQATATVWWRSWCGRPPAPVAAVTWDDVTVTVPVTGPAHPPCREGDNSGIMAGPGAWFRTTDQPPG